MAAKAAIWGFMMLELRPGASLANAVTSPTNRSASFSNSALSF